MKNENYIYEYINAIDKGEIVVGQELYQELEMLVKDIESNKYIFDRNDCLKRIDFIENCVKLTKSPFYGRPMKLMLWQKAFIEAVYSFKMKDGFDRFSQVLLLVARKNGKTETVGGIGFSELIIGNAGEDIVCASNSNEQASLVYDA
ncbi:MAG: terminase large subunit, partial [Lachnospiraceae bacterium]|nr:terminase large subunit [Lachnospiraceae bacterium]